MFIYIILGIIQGITEPLPISSSGHLLIFKSLFKININYETLAIITNFGSLIAILLLFKDEIINYKYKCLVFIGTIPAGIIGLFIKKFKLFYVFESNIKFIGFMLLITALFLFLVRNIKGYKEKINFKDSLIIGLFQSIALIPGISRSGATIVGGISRKLKRENAFIFSFMLYIPISIVTSILGFSDLIKESISINQMMFYIISMFFAFIFTYFSTNFFKKVVINGKLIYFVFYCFIVGIILLII